MVQSTGIVGWVRQPCMVQSTRIGGWVRQPCMGSVD